MKIGGIIIIVLGSLITLGGITGLITGNNDFSLWGPGLIIIGSLLISKYKKREREKEAKENWIEGK